MTTRETRRESYEKVLPDVPNRKRIILKVLESGERTAHEITQTLLQRKVIPYYDRNFVSPRLTELKKEGTIEVTGRKYEGRTDRQVSIWKLRES